MFFADVFLRAGLGRLALAFPSVAFDFLFLAILQIPLDKDSVIPTGSMKSPVIWYFLSGARPHGLAPDV
ncbi:hypothetical protein CXF96_07315 [Stenotrophomonas sp. Betaine-02u-21]|nr:hypothetical protein CXF90_18965 [Stenotrophomonas sp. Betaine-02u-23]PKH74617.1 hypothetical protein CXF96_07315 [Stenotrophomonas sp. Betaine-02u-21]PKH95516.1 hypothetical protein CXG43_12490 [Stenotrophomonas sp. Bg11-02]